MNESLSDLLALYDDNAPLAYASTIPSGWYLDERIANLERRQVFGGNWIARAGANRSFGKLPKEAGLFVNWHIASYSTSAVRRFG